jgi:hypothetical protein
MAGAAAAAVPKTAVADQAGQFPMRRFRNFRSAFSMLNRLRQRLLRENLKNLPQPSMIPTPSLAVFFRPTFDLEFGAGLS